MKLKHSTAISLVLAIATAFAAGGAIAQEAGSRQPVKVVVPFPPGGGSDGIGRALAEALHGVFKTVVIVENKPGAAGNIGAAAVLREPADGRTIFMAANNLTTNPHLYKLQFDPLTDYVPIGLIASSPLVLIANVALPASNLSELVEYSKKSSGPLFYGSPGAATPMHLAGVLVARATGGRLHHVPYRGTGPAMTDLLGGQTQAAVVGLSTAAPYIKAGRVKAIAVFSKKRVADFPDVATALEQGVADSDVVVWYSALLRAGTPEPIVAKLRSAFASLRTDKKFLSKMESAGFNADLSSSDELANVLKTDYARWGRVIKEAGITVE